MHGSPGHRFVHQEDFEPSEEDMHFQLGYRFLNAFKIRNLQTLSDEMVGLFASRYYINDIPFIIYLLQRDDIEVFSTIKFSPEAYLAKYKGNTVANIAAEIKNLDFIKVIAKKYPDAFNYTNSTQNVNSLEIAIRNNWVKGVKVIVESNPSIVNKMNDSGLLPIHFAVHSQNIEIIEILINAGANPQIRDEIGRLPMDYPEVKANPTFQEQLSHLVLLSKIITCKQQYPEFVQFANKYPQFVESLIGEFQVTDFNQIVCIKEYNIIKKVLNPVSAEPIKLEKYEELFRCYPVLPPFGSKKESNEDDKYFENLSKEDVKNIIRKSKHNRDPRSQMQLESFVTAYNDFIDRREMKLLEVAEKQNKLLKRFKENPPSWREAFIERCPILYRCNVMGYKMFHYAARTNNAELLTIFLNHSANIYTVDSEGRNIFHHIAECGTNKMIDLINQRYPTFSFELTQKLVTKEDNSGDFPVFTAIRYNNFQFVKQMLPYLSGQRNKYGQTALFIAVKEQKSRIIAQIDNLGDVSSFDTFGKSPIQYAIDLFDDQNDESKLVFMLLFNQLNNPETIYKYAAKQNKKTILDFLEAQGIKAKETKN